MRNKNRTAAIDWILQRDWKLAITLTFKKDCTEHRARKTMRRLWNGIDRQLYQKAFKKQGKRVERAEQLVLLQQSQQAPSNTLATRTQQAMDKKKRLAGRGTLGAVGTFGTV